MVARGLHRYTYADDVALELSSPTKRELLDGEIYAMGGGPEEPMLVVDHIDRGSAIERARA
jgi:hypothetical protein